MREVVGTQLHVLMYRLARAVCTVRRSSCTVGRVRAHHLEGMNHPSGFGIPSGGGILQLQLFSYASSGFVICLELRMGSCSPCTLIRALR